MTKVESICAAWSFCFYEDNENSLFVDNSSWKVGQWRIPWFNVQKSAVVLRLLRLFGRGCVGSRGTEIADSAHSACRWGGIPWSHFTCCGVNWFLLRSCLSPGISWDTRSQRTYDMCTQVPKQCLFVFFQIDELPPVHPFFHPDILCKTSTNHRRRQRHRRSTRDATLELHAFPGLHRLHVGGTNHAFLAWLGKRGSMNGVWKIMICCG